MVTEQDHDVVVVGAGSGGYATALRAAELGLSVALIEADKVGGTCLHRGCIPTKALLHAAEVADAVRDSDRFGISASLTGVDTAKLNAYQGATVKRLYSGLQGLISGRNITLISGWGRLVGPQTVQVGDQLVRGRHLVLATGSTARSLPGISIGGRILSSDQALAMDWIPASAAIIGGGVIGVEFASIWRSFGSNVSVIEAAQHLVPQEDLAVSKALQRAFRKRDIDVHLGRTLTELTQDEGGVHLRMDNGAVMDAEVALIAVGRGPATSDLGLTEQGLTLDRGFVVVDERQHTGVGNIWAVGDITAGLALAHRGFAHGIAVAERIAGMNPEPVVDTAIPRVTYCDPEIASVGLTETAARELHGEVETLEYNLGGNGKSQILGTNGFVKLVRVANGPIVGVHMLGARMGEQIGEGQLIVNWEAHPCDLASLIHAHPTQNEALGEAALALAGKPLHAHA
ncbi:MAG: dihydrolipoyl dehydrogenase [Beutenbergiaceae bacterium]